MIDEAIVSLLRAVAGVSLRITPSSETVMVYTDLPRCIYHMVGAARRYSDNGNSGLTPCNYFLSIYADKMSAARNIVVNIRKNTPVGLDGYRGTTGGIRIERIYFPEHESFEATEKIEGENRKVARVGLRMRVEYREPV